ncbi:MAG: o-succinylbenzoate synthase [Candidatus Eiseniibacteriota bacterium]
MSLRRVLIQLYSTPLDPPWPSAEGPVRRRVGSILILEDEDGRVGLGETAPFPGFGLETHASSVAALRLAARRLVGLPPDAYLAATADLPCLAPVAASPCARHAIDLALHDLAAQRAGVSIAELLGGERALQSVVVNGTIQRLSPGETVDAARRFAAADFKTLKLKVGGAPLAEDIARVRAVREAMPGLRLRIDANQAWSEGDAIAALSAMRDFDLEYCEQPVAADAIDAMARVRAACSVPIAADESVRDAATVERILAAKAADVLILKPMALGGLHAARSIAVRAEKAGIPVVVTSLLEGPIGRMGALHFAASLGPSPYAHGVALEGVDSPVVPVPSGPGLGAGPAAGYHDAAVLAAAGEGGIE